MNNKRYFHFTIGPVQDFVAQSRRTRDFWAGSFLLSWLSGVAMQASIIQEAEIEFPKPNEKYLDWLTGNQTGEAPRQGCIPNRFKAAINNGFNPDLITENLQKAWEELSDQVYRNDIAPFIKTTDTRQIWDRQIAHFWEMTWAITNDKNDSGILNRRKNWRSYLPPSEPGVKCMMMDGWQELSGTPSPHRRGLSIFWEKLRQNKQKGMKSDLYESESLCAIAFVKRRFVHHFQKLKEIEMPGGWQLHGWTLKSGIPSVSYMATVHWLEEVINQANKNKKINQCLTDFSEKAYELTRDRGGWDNEIKCIRELIEDRNSKYWASHDGNVFFQTMLENKKLYPDQIQAKKVVNALNALRKAADVSSISPFYAVLMMDGDSLGKQMSVAENQTIISESLEKFTNAVPGIVDENNGFLIYAGGDDVLAVFPLEDVLLCAKKLRDCYMGCFTGKVDTILSGAIEYAHIKMPLTKVLHDAHDLLDKVAKEQTGRDALAVRVWKPGGAALQWVQPWKIILSDDKKEIKLLTLVKTFRNASKDDPQFSSKFFYKIRNHFDLLNPNRINKKPVLNKAQASDLMAMVYLNSRMTTDETMQVANQKIAPLLEQCRPHHRNEAGDITENAYLKADGALLVRFLAQKGVE